MAAFTDLRQVTLLGSVTREDGEPATGAVLVSVVLPTQDRAARAVIVSQPERIELVGGRFTASVPGRSESPAPTVEVAVKLDDFRPPVPFQFEVVTEGDTVSWDGVV